MKFLSSKYMTVILLTILGAFFAYDIYSFNLTAWMWAKSIIFLIVFVYMPGKVIADRAMDDDKGLMAVFTGIVLNIGLFILAQYFENILILLIFVVIADIYFVYEVVKNKKIKLHCEDTPVINALLVILIAISPNLIFNFPIGDLSALKNNLDGLDDVFFHMGKIEMFIRDFPIGDWSVYALKDVTFQYHYFFHIWIAEISKITGIEVDFLYFRFFPYFIVSSTFVAATKLGYMLTQNYKKAIMGSFLATIGAGASVLLGIAAVIKYHGLFYLFAMGSPSFVTWAIESPTMAISILFFLVLLYILHLISNGNNRKLLFVLYLVGVIGLTGAKGSTALIFIGALSVYSVIFFDKRMILKIVIPSGIAFLAAYSMIYLNKEYVSGGFGMYSFKDITWMDSSITGLPMIIMLGGYLAGTIGIRFLGLFSGKKDKMTRLIKTGFLLGTALFIISPLRWVNIYWFIPFSIVVSILVLDFIFETKSKKIKNILIAAIIIEICFGASYNISKGVTGMMEVPDAESYVGAQEYEAYKYIQENTEEDSVVWSTIAGENRKNTFDCMTICQRQNLLEGWGFSPYMNYEQLSDEERKNHPVTKILEAEIALLDSDSTTGLDEVLSSYPFVDYLILTLSDIKNPAVFRESNLEEIFRNEDYIIYKTE